MSQPDYYDILGISPTATPAQIRAAHRMYARRYHPDTADDGRGDPDRFAQVQEAYEILSVADFRRRYDNKRAAERGEIPSPGKRRPPKSHCASCNALVYASQLRLYLGRYMCKACIDRKHARDSNRPRLNGFAELCWRMRRIGVWVQVHFAMIGLILCGLGAVGARLAWVRGHVHDRAASETQDVASFSDNPVTATPPANSPSGVASVDTAESHPSGK